MNSLTVLYNTYICVLEGLMLTNSKSGWLGLGHSRAVGDLTSVTTCIGLSYISDQ